MATLSRWGCWSSKPLKAVQVSGSRAPGSQIPFLKDLNWLRTLAFPPSPLRWVSPDEKQRNPRAARGRDQSWSHRYERKACEKLGTRSLRHLYPARALLLLPQGSDRSARHLLRLTPTNFRRWLPARSYRPALRGGQGDPQRPRPRPRLAHSFPIHSVAPLRQPLREPRPPHVSGKLGAGVASARAPSQGWSRLASPIGSATLSTHRPEPLDRARGVSKREGGEELCSDASGRPLSCQERFAPQVKRESSLRESF